MVKPGDHLTCLFAIVLARRARFVKNYRMGGQVLVPHLKNGFAFLFKPERSPFATEWQVLDGSRNVIHTTARPTPGTLR
ncbi:MAG: hypothetical protein AB1445_08935 [Bacillota bacterium]